MNRWVWICICAALGAGALVCGLLVPIHLRAVDTRVIVKAGWSTPALLERGLALANQKQLGAAQLLLQAAQQQGLANREKLGLAVTNLAKEHPDWLAWGGGEPRLERLFASDSHLPKAAAEPFTEFVVRLENREVVLGLLQGSRLTLVQELLRFRSARNTALFPPSQSSSGQALDAALSICGLLLDSGHISPGLSNALSTLVLPANHGGNSQPFEQILMDLMSLGQRLNWSQLAVFVSQIQDPETLRLQANLVRRAGLQLPILFSAVQLSGNPAGVARYLMTFSQTGLQDLGWSLRCGTGGINELLRRNQRLHTSGFLAGFSCSYFSDLAWRTPGLAFTLKWLMYLLGGFCFAAAMHFAWPAVSALEQPLQVRGFHIAREILFALGFLVVVLLLSEPFLAQESQKVDFPFRLRLPTVGSVVPAGNNNAHSSIMNQLSLLTLLLFFVLQSLIYTACLFKLAEIRRQRVTARIKLRLLENEDHLFDAGLYLGFVGTIISLILVSLGVIKPSLMAAYSSTSFGIIFVSIFKIFHLRPVRRRLLLEAEALNPESFPAAASPRLATPS